MFIKTKLELSVPKLLKSNMFIVLAHSIDLIFTFLSNVNILLDIKLRIALILIIVYFLCYN